MMRGGSLGLLLIMALLAPATGQELVAPTPAAPTPTASSSIAAPTTLLPVYGVDLLFDSSAVDGSGFPSSSPEHPFHGTNAVFEQIWQRLSPSGFGVIRFPLDIADEKAAVFRLANLCAWADQRQISLLPVLSGWASGAAGEAGGLETFVRDLAATMRAAGADAERSYGRILFFELGGELNVPRRVGGLAAQDAARGLVAAAAALRLAEQGALEGSSLYLTPIVVTASFDQELLRAGAAPNAPLAEPAYLAATQSLLQALAPIAASPDIEAVALSWFPGTWSAGGVERWASWLDGVSAGLPGKQLIVTTGYSTAFRSAAEQKSFFTLTFANLAEYRAGLAADAPFLGVVFHKALGWASSSAPAPEGFEATRAGWDGATLARELESSWSGSAPSAALAHWENEVEAQTGLLALADDEQGGLALTEQPAGESLQQIADTVAGAELASSPPAGSSTQGTTEGTVTPGTPNDPKAPNPVTEKLKGVMLSLLDQVLGQLASGLEEEINEELGGNTSQNGGESGSPGSASVPPQVSIASASCVPSKPKVEQQVTCTIGLTNTSPDQDATGLSLGLLDSEGYLLSEEAMTEPVDVARGAQTTVKLGFRPHSAGSQAIAVKLYGPSYEEIGTSSADTVTVVTGSSASPGGSLTAVSRFPDLLQAVGQKSTGLMLARPGLVKVGTMSLTRPRTASGEASFSLPVANTSKRRLSDQTALLVVEGKTIETRSLPALAPGQSRTLSFTGVRLAPGQEARVLLKAGTGEPLLVARWSDGSGRVSVPQKKALVRPVTSSSQSTPPRVRPPMETTRLASRPVVAPTALPRLPGTPSSKAPGTRTASVPPKLPPPGSPPPTAPPSTLGKVAVNPRTPPPSSPTLAPGRGLPPLPQGKPDFALSAAGIQVSPVSGPAGQAVTVRVQVSNLGAVAGQGGVVEFQLRGATGAPGPRGSQRLGILQAGSRGMAEWRFTRPQGGPWRLEVTVQAPGDSSPRNNAAAVTLPALPTIQRKGVVGRPPVGRVPPAGRTRDSGAGGGV